MAKTLHSNNITFIDLTDTKKLDVHISSNLPTTQIYDANTLLHFPDWTIGNKLELALTVYADSTDVTNDLTSIQWYRQIGNNARTLIENNSTNKLIISNNELTDPVIGGSIGVISYICVVTYNTKTAENQITFSRTNTGLNGTDGVNAPPVLAQYSVYGDTWTDTLNPSIHKYVRYSYDGGVVWTPAIKIMGEDGTSVVIKGTAYTQNKLISGEIVSLFTDPSYSTPINTNTLSTGDSYLVSGYLCVYNKDDNNFICTGTIQGPAGNNGVSSYVFIQYALDANGTSMSDNPGGKTYIGIHISNTNNKPDAASSYTWSKFVGESAKSIILNGSSQIFRVDKFDAVSPAMITVRAQVVNTLITDWTFSTNGGQKFSSEIPNGITLNTNDNLVVIDGTLLTSNSIVISASDGIYSDTYTIYKVFDGSDGSTGKDGQAASMAFLTNENVTFSANASGQIPYTVITTNVVAYNGTTKITPTVGNITGLPVGMTAIKGEVKNSEIPITFTIAENAMLGSLSGNSGAVVIPVNGPVYTNLIFTWSKVNSGAKGDTGDKGADAYTVMLTNEAHTFAGDINHAYADSVTTQILGYKGATAQSVTITSVNGKTAAIVDTDTGITGLKFKCSALSGTSPTITFTCTESFTSASGYIPIVVSIDGVSFTRMFNYSIAFKGATGGTGAQGPQGQAATSYWLISSASAVQKTSTGTITVTPSTLTFTGKSKTGTNAPVDYACRWIIDSSTDGTTYTNLYTSTANEVSKAITVATTYKTIRARMYMAGGTTALLDEQIIPIVSDGTKGDTGRGVLKITEYYLATTASSGVTTSTSGWTEAVQTIDIIKKYLWNYELITYTDNTTSTTTPVIIGVFGNTGATGKGISSVAERYLATTLSSGVTTSTSGWTPEIQTLTSTKKYLWNYEIITYTDGTTSTISPVIIGVYGDKGVGISSVTVTYGTSTSASTQPTSWQTTLPTVAEGSYLWTRTVTDYTDASIADTVTLTYAKQGVKGDTGSSGSSVTVLSIQYQEGASATTAPTGTWSNSVVAVAEGKYLWTKTAFSDGKTAYGVAKQGAKGSAGADAYTVILTNESHVFAGNVSSAIASSATTQVMAYKGSASQSVTIVSVDGKTASTSSTATSITGLSFACSALSGTTPTITFTCTTSFVSPSGTIPIVVKVDGVTITKMFTYGIAFKGATGSQGTTGTAASLVDITPSAHYFKSTTGKDGTFTPDYIYLYPRFQTVTFSKWEYSINGGTTWVAASGANGLSISTYNSVANTLRIARTSTLYTDTVTSISFRCVSSNASVYDTVSIAKIYDVVDLQIGGRNLLPRTDNTQKDVAINTSAYGVIPQLVPSTQLWKSGYVDIAEYGLSIGDTLTFQAYLIPQNNIPIAVRVWGSSNGTSGSPITNGNYVSSPGISSCTFTMTSQYLYLSVITQSAITESIVEKYSNCKLERGNKATDWSPAPEDLNNINFQIYAPDGYLLTNDLQSLTLQTFAYEGSIEITSGATFQWSHLIDDAWIDISGATSTTLTVTKSDVLKAKSYRCIMIYKTKTYESTITVQDKTDTYNSIMCISSNAKGTECYWVLHTIVYSDTSEIDPLLGPISINAPELPVNGDYWYAVDSTNATVQLKKYNGTAWVDSTDKQSLTYLWNIINDGSDKTPIGGASKVQVVSCRDFTATATLMCDVSNEVDGVLTQSSLSITDASDPIVSQTEPTSAVDGQIWIKPNTNGSYNMFLWSNAAQSWIPSDMDTRNKVYTSKPSSYSKGDIWITESDTAHSKYLEGTLLQATKDSTTYNEDDWSATLKYDKDIDEIKGTLYDLSQYVTITLAGLKIGAVNSNGELSPFTSLFTSTELAFYQNSDKLLTLANNQLTAPRIVVEEELEVDGKISLGNLQITIESNGSFSFAVTK